MTHGDPLPPTVLLTRPASDLLGRRIHFVPVRDGVEQEVKGTIQLASARMGWHVGACYTSPVDRKEAVYWFTQREISALFAD